MEAYIYNADIYCKECAMQIMFDLLAEALTKAGAKDARRDMVWDGEAYRVSLPPEETGVIDHFITPSEGNIQNYVPCSGFTVSTETGIDGDFEPVNHTLMIYPPDDERDYDSGEWPKGPYDQDRDEADSPQNCGSGEACASAFSNGVAPTSIFGDSPELRPIMAGVFLENALTSAGYSYLKLILDEHGADLRPAVKEWADFYGFTYHYNAFTSPHDWLDAYISDLQIKAQYAETLATLTRTLASLLDGDRIQDMFQSEMENDGYFKKSGWYSEEMPDPEDSGRNYRAGYEHAAGYPD